MEELGVRNLPGGRLIKKKKKVVTIVVRTEKYIRFSHTILV